MTDYKDTLNLPKTAFSMKANLANREPGMVKQWQENNLYAALRKHCEGREKFIMLDGPPYANGNIHLGHAVNKVLKDIIVKSKTLSGYDAPFVPNWDCHGLPIEHQVEKKHGKVGKKIDAKTFRQKCREYAAGQVAKQAVDFRRLGVLADFEHPTCTMDFAYEAGIIETLADIVERGHLSRGEKPVHWCNDCGSSLAEAEVEYQDKISPSIVVHFDVVDHAAFVSATDVSLPENTPVSVLIWTTTPWTLPGNVAVCAGEDIDYSICQVTRDGQTQVVLLATALMSSIFAEMESDSYTVIKEVKGAALSGLMLSHPFLDRQVPILLGDHVSTEAGTGFVHTAPSHGQDDFTVCQAHGVEGVNYIGPNGCFVESAPLFAGLFVAKANPEIIATLRTCGKLWSAAEIEHSYPHCWRHKTPLIFRATPQWFISMSQQGLRDDALAAIRQVKWQPARGETRITSMIAERPDWCISRQRYWGTPIPLFIHRETGELHPDTVGLMRRVADRVAADGIESWFESEASDWLLSDDASEYELCRDTIDVWFDSGASNHCVLERVSDLQFPADVYIEGSDQHRGWFQTSLLVSLARRGEAPYRTVVTHGFTIDDQGRKMSKSLGNIVSPQDVMKTLGADVLRLWIASANYHQEMALSDEILKRTTDTYRRIRNTARFLLSNCHDFDPAAHMVPVADMLALDQWAVARMAAVQETVLAAYDTFYFLGALQALHHFCVIDMGGFYLDIIKDRQYTMQRDSLGRRSAQSAMYLMVSALARLVAPILTFTAEEIWQHMPGGVPSESIFFEVFSDVLVPLSADAVLSMADWDRVMFLREAVNKAVEAARNAGEVGSALGAEVVLCVAEADRDILSRMAGELRFLFITSALVVEDIAQVPSGVVVESDVGVVVTRSAAEKCERCWHHVADVGRDPAHPGLCGRCVENVAHAGEARRFA